MRKKSNDFFRISVELIYILNILDMLRLSIVLNVCELKPEVYENI